MVCLLFATAGFMVSYHYCDNELVETAINEKTDSCCDFMGSGNCCRTETEYVQIEDDFLSSFHEVSLMDLSSSPALAMAGSLYRYIYYHHNLILTDYSGSPPVSTPEKLSLLQSYLC